MNDEELKRALSHDFSSGTEEFADRVLSESLSELVHGDDDELSDDVLDLLSAAGAPNFIDSPWE